MKNHVGRTIGVIQVLNKHNPIGPNGAAQPQDLSGVEFSQHDEELLAALATQAAVSIDNSRLFLSVIQKNMQLVETKEQLEHRVSDLKLLFELESAMGRATTPDELARAVVVEAARACQAAAGGLLVDEGESGLWMYFVDLAEADPSARRSPSSPPSSAPPSALDSLRSASLIAVPMVHRLPVKRGEGVVGWSMLHNQAASVPPADWQQQWAGSPDQRGLKDDDSFAPLSRMRTNIADRQILSAIAVPLENAEESAIGAIALYNSTRPGGFTQDDRSLLRLVSANASTALQLFRTRAEQEKVARLTTIGRLLSGVMHDMRTPLTVISGYVQIMAGEKEEKVRQEHARTILKQFDALSAMQREVLEFARGERSILLRKVYLGKFFEDLESQLRLELSGYDSPPKGAPPGPGQVALVVVVEDRGTARFDEAKITRALHNLVRNAFEAMAQIGGTVTVRVWRENGEILIRVSDTGRGIPDEIKDRLFQSFVTAGKRGGTGLGLAIVKKIVDEHHGEISVASSPEGAVFTIRLPQSATQ